MYFKIFFISLLTSVIGFNYPENIRKFGYLHPAEVDVSLLPDLNFGFHDVVLQEHWDSETINEDDPPVLYASTLDVTMTGKTMISFGLNNVTINCFQGLKYAEKAKRFEPPVALKTPYYEEDSIEANHLPEKCAQHGIFAPNIGAGSEDCLYLNVYTPLMPDKDGAFDELYPVMIFFHGGAFIWGDSSLYLPTRLLDQKVLLVVPHYRLGSFGFFSTMDERAPGNIGLYDQQMSMKWVQDHIESFGGDKSKVTIFGQSAGSASVNYHLIIPSSAGLMHHVIGESGSALEHWSLDEDPLDSAFAIANFLGCNTTNITIAYECMMEYPADTLAVGINDLSKHDRLQGSMGFRGAAPIIQNPDMDLSAWDTEVLITKPPVDYFKDETFNSDVDLMIGANKHEGSFIFGIMYSSYLVRLNLTENEEYLQEKMIPDLLHSFGIDDSTHSLSESLAEYYLAGANRSDLESSMPGMIDLSGVLFQKAGTMETAKLHSYYKKRNVNTYLYAFEYESEDTTFDWLFMGSEFPDYYLKGVTHSDELLYLFSWPAVMDGTQFAIRDGLVKLWTNFATYGNPTPDEEEGWSQVDVTIEQWPNFDIDNEYYILIEEDSFHIEQRYSDRWTIANDESLGIVIPPGRGNTTDITPTDSTTLDPSKTYSHSDEEYNDLEIERNDLKDERDAYLATMIVFIILYVIAAGCGGYFFYINKKMKKTTV